VRTIVVGRVAPAQLRVDDPYVSDRHCAIHEYASGVFSVEDLGSTNGTYLVPPGGGEQRVRGLRSIPHGWRVRVGRTTLPWTAP
jgi:pSer/pThr/pTyr-binding forkhead associated (FHA) protein